MWGRLFFFSPKAIGIFGGGGGVFSARSSFRSGKCPSLPGYGGGGTAQLGVPTAAGDFGLRSLQLPKGDRPPAPVG